LQYLPLQSTASTDCLSWVWCWSPLVVLLLLLLQSPHICLADIAHFISSKKVARVELREEDILTIMETLIADGR
jgi:hypothetical protein